MVEVLLQQVSAFFLAFSHDTIILPVSIIGYIWLDKKIFFHAMCLILLSMLLNFALKITFQVPLSPTVGKEGFAFPSGHMQSSIVFYGWLLGNTHRSLIRLPMLIVLIGIGAALIYCGYHNYLDLLGALLFGVLMMGMYYWLAFKKFKGGVSFQLILWILSISTFLMLYVRAICPMEAHLWMAYYAIVGLTLSECCFKNALVTIIKYKVLATVFCFGVLMFVGIATHKLAGLIKLPNGVMQLQWLLITFCIPFSLYVCNPLKAHCPNGRM